MTLAQLIAAGIAPTQARRFVDALNDLLPSYGVNTPIRQAAFVAQCGHESTGFAVLEESLYYRDPVHIAQIFRSAFRSPVDAAPYTKNPQALANRAYALRNGNGDEKSGDGWRYRGRGLIQLTGRANYALAGHAVGRRWVDNPDDLLTPPEAVRSACWYWQTHGCNELADASNIDAITQKINPAMVGKFDRRQRFDEALDAFRAVPATT